MSCGERLLADWGQRGPNPERPRALGSSPATVEEGAAAVGARPHEARGGVVGPNRAVSREDNSGKYFCWQH